jgi:hypothetical protein
MSFDIRLLSRADILDDLALLLLKSAASDGPPLLPGGRRLRKGQRNVKGTLLRRRTFLKRPIVACLINNSNRHRSPGARRAPVP